MIIPTVHAKAIFTAQDVNQSSMHFACKTKAATKACAWAHVNTNRASK